MIKIISTSNDLVLIFFEVENMPNNLRDIREQNQCRMLELTARSGVSASILCAIERYDYVPRETTKSKIASALGVPVVVIWPQQIERNKR